MKKFLTFYKGEKLSDGVILIDAYSVVSVDQSPGDDFVTVITTGGSVYVPCDDAIQIVEMVEYAISGERNSPCQKARRQMAPS